jgi:hypothetical protein
LAPAIGSMFWQSHLNTKGTHQLMYFKNFLSSRKWYNLVPDQSHTLLTAGCAPTTPPVTYATTITRTMAKTPDNTLAVVYAPVVTH